MKRPTVEELTKDGKYNRYTLVIATAKCAREITEELENDENIDLTTLSKEEAKRLSDLRDEKPLKTAINMLAKGEIHIVDSSLDEKATH